MKQYISIMLRYRLFLIVVILFSSCLTHGLDDLPNFEDADIVDVKFDYRYKDPSEIWIDGEPLVRNKSLTVTDRVIDTDRLEITCILVVPEADDIFSESIRNEVTLEHLVGKFNLSSGASIQPVEGSPTLGVPGDFSGICKYKVTAANKSTKVWTIHVQGLRK